MATRRVSITSPGRSRTSSCSRSWAVFIGPPERALKRSSSESATTSSSTGVDAIAVTIDRGGRGIRLEREIVLHAGQRTAGTRQLEAARCSETRALPGIDLFQSPVATAACCLRISSCVLISLKAVTNRGSFGRAWSASW